MAYNTVVIFGGDTDPGYRVTQKAIAAGLKALVVLRGQRELDFLKRIGAEIVFCDPTDRAQVGPRVRGPGRRGVSPSCACSAALHS